MRATVELDDDLLKTASRLTGLSNPTALVHAALTALVEHEAARRLARLGGTQPDMEDVPRRRPEPE